MTNLGIWGIYFLIGFGFVLFSYLQYKEEYKEMILTYNPYYYLFIICITIVAAAWPLVLVVHIYNKITGDHES